MKKKSSLKFSTLLDLFFDLLIDLALIGLGVAFYYQFVVSPIFPVTISPALTDLVGGYTNAIYILCGVPFVIGLVSLVRTSLRFIRKLAGR